MSRNEKRPELEPTRVMNFTGKEIDYLLQRDIKLLSVRVVDPKYDFEIGEVIEANYLDIPGGSSFLVVIDNVKQPLKDFSEAELLLDGYESVAKAVEDLRTFGEKYKDITEESVVQGVMTMSEDKFFSLSREQQEELISKGGRAVLRENGDLAKELFYPAWFRWIAGRGYWIEDWWNFLLKQGLADEGLVKRIEKENGLDMVMMDRVLMESIWETAYQLDPDEDLKGWYEGVIKLKPWVGNGED